MKRAASEELLMASFELMAVYNFHIIYSALGTKSTSVTLVPEMFTVVCSPVLPLNRYFMMCIYNGNTSHVAVTVGSTVS